jgi:hypothetical protein
VATIRAPATDILNFAAHHIEAGAHRVWIYLDAPSPEAEAALRAHPKCRVTRYDEAYWTRHHKRRRGKHQVRQCLNATHVYARAQDVTWLAHLDVDEFILPHVADGPGVADALSALPGTCQTARVRPMEALAVADPADAITAFKALAPPGPTRAAALARVYPAHHHVLNAGFVSHVAGKLFVRTGMAGGRLRIHNFRYDGAQNPGERELEALRLAHLHGTDWNRWRAALDYRLLRGSQRAGLGTGNRLGALHTHLTALLADGGDAALRDFFEEVCADTPRHRARLASESLLQLQKLARDAARTRVFRRFAA